jgi:hypothetical protein
MVFRKSDLSRDRSPLGHDPQASLRLASNAASSGQRYREPEPPILSTVYE